MWRLFIYFYLSTCWDVSKWILCVFKLFNVVEYLCYLISLQNDTKIYIYIFMHTYIHDYSQNYIYFTVAVYETNTQLSMILHDSPSRHWGQIFTPSILRTVGSFKWQARTGGTIWWWDLEKPGEGRREMLNKLVVLVFFLDAKFRSCIFIHNFDLFFEEIDLYFSWVTTGTVTGRFCILTWHKYRWEEIQEKHSAVAWPRLEIDQFFFGLEIYKFSVG